METKWKDSTRKFELTIKEKKLRLKAKLIKQNKYSAYHISCSDLELEKDVCDADYFMKNKILDEEEQLKVAKELSVKSIYNALKRRKEIYEILLYVDLDKIFKWEKPKKAFVYDATKSNIVDYDFSFMYDKKEISGSIRLFACGTTSYLFLPWIGTYRTIEDCKDFNEVKNKFYEIIKKECQEKLEILKSF